ncbi:MAG: lmo0937 family membrane protein [Acidobacteriota bacterium]
MFITLAIILAIAWLLGFTMFHVAGFAIHILLIAAVISLVAHFMKGGRTRIA